MRAFLFLALCLLAVWPGQVSGQVYNPYQPLFQDQNDPRIRRARRERAVFHCGGTVAARSAVEQYGDDFVAAVAACSPAVACRLAEFAAAPDGLCKLPRPSDLLRVISLPNHGDDVAVFAIQHAAELCDVDRFGAFCLAPLEYALHLQSLDAGAALYRANRLSAPPASTPTISDLRLPADWRPIAVCVAVVVLAAWWWRRRQNA